MSKRVFCLEIVAILFLVTAIIAVVNIYVITQNHRSVVLETEIPALGLAASTEFSNYIEKKSTLINQPELQERIRKLILMDKIDYKLEIEKLKLLDKKNNLDGIYFIKDSNETIYGADGVEKLSERNLLRDGWYYAQRENSAEGCLNIKNFRNDDKVSMFLNVSIYDNHGKYIGLLGQEFNFGNVAERMYEFEDAWNINIYVFRNDGILLYSTNDDIKEKTNLALENFWSASILDNLRRSKEEKYGLSIEDNKTNSVLWGVYVTPWSSFFVLEKTNKSILSSIKFKIVLIVLCSFLLFSINLIILFIILPKYSKYAFLNSSSSRSVIQQLQAVIDAQDQVLRFTERRMTAMSRDLAILDKTGVLASDLINLCAGLQKNRKTIHLLLLAQTEETNTPWSDLFSTFQQSVMNFSSEFANKNLKLHVEFPKEKILIRANSNLLRLSFETFLNQVLLYEPEDTTVVLTANKDGESVFIEFFLPHLIGEFYSARFHLINYILNLLNTELKVLPDNSGGGIYRVEFEVCSGTNI